MSSHEAHNLRALWFGDDASLLGHLHTPCGAAVDLAVVICPVPFGYENVCGHRGLRILGDRLAAGGIAALRFDFPGSGDSDGEQTLAAWKAAVATAVAVVRRESGCARVGLIGVGLGGSVALASVDAGVDVDKLILWGAPARGRSWLRRQRAYQRVAALSPDAAAPPPPPLPENTEVLSGFPLAETLAQELATLDIARATTDAWPVTRTRPAALVISRTTRGDEENLCGALSTRGISAIVQALDGFDQMFDEPHLSIAPEPIFACMRDWLSEGIAHRAPYGGPPAIGRGVTTRMGRQGLVEETARYSQGDGGKLFSIETRPVGREPNQTWLVLLTGRAVRHIGPNRIWVRLAREFAAAGFASLRLDGRSVGDSDGAGNGLMPNAEYYQEHIYDDIERVMEIAVAAGAKQFLMAGICSGATASYQIAWRRSDVRAIVLLNPLQLRHDPEDDERAKVQMARKWWLRNELWANPKSYLRLFESGLPMNMLKLLFSRAVLTAPFRRKAGKDEPDYVVSGFYGLAQKPVDIDVFLSEGDLSVLFMERHFGPGLVGFEREQLRVHRVHNTDHTLRALFSQERFFEVMRAALGRIAGDKSGAAAVVAPPRSKSA